MLRARTGFGDTVDTLLPRPSHQRWKQKMRSSATVGFMAAEIVNKLHVLPERLCIVFDRKALKVCPWRLRHVLNSCCSLQFMLLTVTVAVMLLAAEH